MVKIQKLNLQRKIPPQEEPKTEEQTLNQKEDNSSESGSMIEDIEVGSGCVADMQKVSNPAPSQRELELNEILNSPMLDKAKELLHVKKITVKTRN